MNQRTAYPRAVSDDEWAFVAPSLTVLPRRWAAERAFACKSRFRRVVRDYERLLETVAGLHFVAFSCLMLHQIVSLLPASP